MAEFIALYIAGLKIGLGLALLIACCVVLWRNFHMARDRLR